MPSSKVQGGALQAGPPLNAFGLTQFGLTQFGLTPRELEAATTWLQINGFCIVRRLYTPGRIREFKDEAERLKGRLDINLNNLRTELFGNGRLSKIDPVGDVSEVFRHAWMDHRPLHQLLDAYFGKYWDILKDKLIYKPEGHPGFGAHQDIVFYPRMPEDLLAAMVALDPCTPQNGYLEVIPGSHQRALMPKGAARNLVPSKIPDGDWVPIDLDQGDAALFHGRLVHRSGPNQTDLVRRACFATFSTTKLQTDRGYWLEYYEERKRTIQNIGIDTFQPGEDRSFVPPVRRCESPPTYGPLQARAQALDS